LDNSNLNLVFKKNEENLVNDAFINTFITQQNRPKGSSNEGYRPENCLMYRQKRDLLFETRKKQIDAEFQKLRDCERQSESMSFLCLIDTNAGRTYQWPKTPLGAPGANCSGIVCCLDSGSRMASECDDIWRKTSKEINDKYYQDLVNLDRQYPNCSKNPAYQQQTAGTLSG
jgi:hypothetical protein